MNRDVVKLALLLGVMLALIGAFYGCASQALPASSWSGADSRAHDIGQKVSSAAAQVSGSAAEIASAARAGHDATPENVRPTLDPFWSRILANAQVLVTQGSALADIRKDIDTLKAEVQAGKKEMQQTAAALEAEKKGRTEDNTAWEKKLTAANSKWESMFRTISWLAIVAIGIAVAVGVLMHDFRISIAGGAGGLAVVIACMIVGHIQHWLPWVAGGLILVVGLWVLIESLIRKSFWQAIKTNPMQDVQDLMNRNATSTLQAVS